jgi:hypothetical protein
MVATTGTAGLPLFISFSTSYPELPPMPICISPIYFLAMLECDIVRSTECGGLATTPLTVSGLA